MSDITYSVRPVRVQGAFKYGVFENANLVYTCDYMDDAIHYMEIYKMLMR